MEIVKAAETNFSWLITYIYIINFTLQACYSLNAIFLISCNHWKVTFMSCQWIVRTQIISTSDRVFWPEVTSSVTLSIFSPTLLQGLVAFPALFKTSPLSQVTLSQYSPPRCLSRIYQPLHLPSSYSSTTAYPHHEKSWISPSPAVISERFVISLLLLLPPFNAVFHG